MEKLSEIKFSYYFYNFNMRVKSKSFQNKLGKSSNRKHNWCLWSLTRQRTISRVQLGPLMHSEEMAAHEDIPSFRRKCARMHARLSGPPNLLSMGRMGFGIAHMSFLPFPPLFMSRSGSTCHFGSTVRSWQGFNASDDLVSAVTSHMGILALIFPLTTHWSHDIALNSIMFTM